MEGKISHTLFYLLDKCRRSSEFQLYPLNEQIRDLLVPLAKKEILRHTLIRSKHPTSGNTILKEAALGQNESAVKILLKYLVCKETKDTQEYLETAAVVQNTKSTSLIKSFIAEQRSEEFIILLAETYSKKYEEIMRKLLADDEKVRKEDENISRLKYGMNHVPKSSPFLRFEEPFSVPVSDSFSDDVEQMNRAKRMIAAHAEFLGEGETSAQLPKRFKELLILDGFEIFSCFEEQLVNKTSYQEWTHIVHELTTECADRIMNYLLTNNYEERQEEMRNVEGYLCKCFANTYIIGPQTGKWGTWMYYTGVKLKNLATDPVDHSTRYYVRHDGGSVPGWFGYRKVFNFENQTGSFSEKYKRISCVSLLTPDMGFLLTNQHQKDKVILKAKFELGMIPEKATFGEEDEEYMAQNLRCSTTTQILYNVRDPVRPFIGRGNYIAELHDWFVQANVQEDAPLVRKSSSRSVMVVTGSCGIGKTELVRKFCNDLEKNESNNVIFLDGANLEQSFYQLYKHLGYVSSKKEYKDETLPMNLIVRVCYSHVNTRPTLIVLLDVRCFKDIGTYVPISQARFKHVQVVITSKTPLNHLTDTWRPRFLPLKAFSEKECNTLMCNLGIRKGAIIAELSSALDYSPLALKQVKMWILQTQFAESDRKRNEQIATSIATDLIQSFVGNKKEHSSVVINIFETEVGPDTKTIAKSWSSVFDTIRGKRGDAVGELAVDIFTALAYMESVPVSLEKLMKSKVQNQQDLNQAIELLQKYNIIFPEADSQDQWKMRKLVKKVVRFQSRIGGSEVLNQKLAHVLGLMLELINISSEHGLDLPLDLIGHIQFVWSYALRRTRLVEKYILNYDYSSGRVNSFLHILLKYDKYDFRKILIDQLSKVKDDDVRSEKIKGIVSSQMMADGSTPLHFAVTILSTAVRLKAVKLFLRWEAPLTFRDNRDKTPLHLAAEWGHTDVVRILLEEYERLHYDLGSQVDNGLNTLVSMAMKEGHVETAGVIRDWLKKHAINTNFDKGRDTSSWHDPTERVYCQAAKDMLAGLGISQRSNHHDDSRNVTSVRHRKQRRSSGRFGRLVFLD